MAGGPTRRALLAASAAAVPILISGCRGVQVLGAPPPPAPEVRLLRAAIIAEQLMVSRYHAILAGPAANAAAAAKLAGLLAEHEQHLAQLKSRLIIPPGSAQSRGLAAVGSGGLNLDLPDSLGALSADEHAASQRLATELLTAPPALAQLLASISASEATHVPVLDQLRRTA